MYMESRYDYTESHGLGERVYAVADPSVRRHRETRRSPRLEGLRGRDWRPWAGLRHADTLIDTWLNMDTTDEHSDGGTVDTRPSQQLLDP